MIWKLGPVDDNSMEMETCAEINKPWQKSSVKAGLALSLSVL